MYILKDRNLNQYPKLNIQNIIFLYHSNMFYQIIF